MTVDAYLIVMLTNICTYADVCTQNSSFYLIYVGICLQGDSFSYVFWGILVVIKTKMLRFH